MTITSTSFRHHGVIPSRYTCDGQNVSPPLTWSGVPENTKSLVLLVDEPDAYEPKEHKMPRVHWVLYNIPPDTQGLPEGIAAGALPHGTLQGTNDWHEVGYRGPCPPTGSHHFVHKLVALNVMLPDLQLPSEAGLETLIHSYTIERAELIGRYQRQHT